MSFSDLNDKALSSGLAQSWYPNAKQQGQSLRTGNLAGDKGSSLWICLKTGRWKDHATGDSGSDLISLYAAKENIAQSTAKNQIGDMLGKGATARITPATPKRWTEDLPDTKEDTSQAALRIWNESIPIERTEAETYLQGRGISSSDLGVKLGHAELNLRFYERCYHADDQKHHPALIAGITTWPNKTPHAIQRTYLEDGKKLSSQQAKKTLGPMQGGAVQFGTVGDTLILAEGIETALSVHLVTSLPCWAVLSASNYSGLVLPNNIKTIIIAADHDKAGLESAKKAALSWRTLGINALIACPENPGEDCNDVLQREGLEAVKALIDKASPPPETLEEAVTRLSALKPLDYEQAREAEAKKYGIRVTVLDEEVCKKRPTSEDKENKKQIGLQAAEPWDEEVNGEDLFDDLVSAFNRYLSLQPFQAQALALWSIFSYCIDAGNIAPKLLIYSPEKRCGKTTLLDVLLAIVWKPLPASNISPAVIYRVIESVGGTIVIDEADTFIRSNPEINGIINSAHRKSLAFVLRCDGDEHEPKQFSTWAPNIIAMIGKPQDTIVDRSILIEMKRKKPGDNVERFIPHKAEEDLHILARKIARWSKDHFDTLCLSDPKVPSNLNDRAADNWRPLLAIASCISEACRQTAISCALTLSESDQNEDNSSAGVLLLADMKDILNGKTNIFTEDLLSTLHALEDRPWAEWNRGKPISARQIGRLLKPYGISSQNITDYFGHQKKGYKKTQFQDAFARYLPDLSVHPSKGPENKGFTPDSIRPEEHQRTDKNLLKPAEIVDLDGWTDVEVF